MGIEASPNIILHLDGSGHQVYITPIFAHPIPQEKGYLVFRPAEEQIVVDPSSHIITRKIDPYPNPLLRQRPGQPLNAGFCFSIREDNHGFSPDYLLRLGPQFQTETTRMLETVIDQFESEEGKAKFAEFVRNRNISCTVSSETGLDACMSDMSGGIAHILQIDQKGLRSDLTDGERPQDTDGQWVGHPPYRFNETYHPFSLEVATLLNIQNIYPKPGRSIVRVDSDLYRLVSGVNFCSTDFGLINDRLRLLAAAKIFREEDIREIVNPYLKFEKPD